MQKKVLEEKDETEDRKKATPHVKYIIVHMAAVK